MAYAATKEQAHESIERIDAEQVGVVVQLMEKLLDPVAFALANAPAEDEQISEEETRRAAETRARGFAGRATPHEDVLKEFGMTPEDVERFCREPLDITASSR